MHAGPAAISLRRQRLLYLGLLAVQTLCVTLLVFELMPFFWHLIDDLGEVQDIPASGEVLTSICVLVFQACYWWRLHHLRVPFAPDNQLISHLLLFVGRLSFFFASTLASLVFFRHVPFVAPSNLTLPGTFRLVLFFAVLFSWFCFSLELERLGKSQSRA